MKAIKAILVSTMCALMPIAATAQKVFDKGDRKADLTVGVGIVAYPDNSNVTFDQHLGMEWGIANFGDRFTLGLGFNVNNTYGGTFGTEVAGEYDYTYTRTSYGRIYHYSTKKWETFNDTKEINRKGVGTAEADISREDINAQITVALHFSPMKRLDTYAKIGAGVGYMHWMVSNLHNEEGFKSADVNEHNETSIRETTDRYQYNDLDHVKWDDIDSKVVPAISVYVGATYMITDRWGVDAQAGLISANLKGSKKGYPNSYSVFAVGASYRF